MAVGIFDPGDQEPAEPHVRLGQSRGSGSTTALVGSYETVAQALIDLPENGCDLLSIRGWDVFEDARDYAPYVLPLVRRELARREANGPAPILNPDSAPELVHHAGR